MIKLIENDLPIKFISKISKKEANKKKPIYGIHKWFGRKTDAIFRSILLALNLNQSEKDIFNSIYYSSNKDILKGKVILDPFMGGGVTLTNTLRLGGKAIGVDVNPVAWFITKSELQVPNKNYVLNQENIINQLEKEFLNLEKNIGKEIEEEYTTYIYDENTKIKKKVNIMYVFWVKEIICPKCNKKSKLFPNYVLTKLKKKNFKNYNICPFCNEIVRGNEDTLVCLKCGHEFDKNNGIYKNGKFKCNHCGEHSNLIKDVMKKQNRIMKHSMIAIQYYDAETRKKGFKIPDKYDIDNYNKTKRKNKDIKKYIPLEEIPEGFNTKQLKNYNYNYWKQMFNYRQLYYLAKLLEEINKIDDNIIKELFLCVFSNTINANNMFCVYNCQYGKIEPLFGDHHMAPVMNPIENNLWGTRLGRGSFRKYFKALIESKKFNMRPYERINIDGKSSNIILSDEKFFSKCADSFKELLECNKNVMIKCTTGENLFFIPDKSIDAVVTDPPYYLAINYSEISEFFYVWERIILKNNYKFFKHKHISSKNEVIANKSKGISKDEFITRLSKCFYELKRVLKDKAPLVLTYNSSSPSGWELIFTSLLKVGFYIEKVYPVHTELRAGLIDNRRCKMNYDLIIVAKTHIDVNYKRVNIDDFMKMIEIEFEKTYEELSDNEITLQDILLIKAGKAFELYSMYPNIYEKEKITDIKYILDKIYLLKDI